MGEIHVYAAALRRRTAAPKRGHVRKLNASARWAQANPLRIDCPATTRMAQLAIHGGAPFRKEQKSIDAGRALRFATFLQMGRAGPPGPREFTSKRLCHLQDWQRGALKTSIGGTFSVELMSVMSSTDHGPALATTFHEVIKKPAWSRCRMAPARRAATAGNGA